MDLGYKDKAAHHAMGFESSYDYYDEQYKISDNPTVWRYMNADHFESLLSTKSLFFTKPTAFLDPLSTNYMMWNMRDVDKSMFATTEDLKSYLEKVYEFSALSSWHINEHESAGMWDLFLKSQDGIAIRTTYDRLLGSIKDLRYKVFARKVQYIDFAKKQVSENIFDTLFYKRKSYSYENELRLLIIASRIDAWKSQQLFIKEEIYASEWQSRMDALKERSFAFSHLHGNLVRCDLAHLFTEIYVSPKSSPAFVQKIKALLCEHGLAYKDVIQSDLARDYIY